MDNGHSYPPIRTPLELLVHSVAFLLRCRPDSQFQVRKGTNHGLFWGNKNALTASFPKDGAFWVTTPSWTGPATMSSHFSLMEPHSPHAVCSFKNPTKKIQEDLFSIGIISGISMGKQTNKLKQFKPYYSIEYDGSFEPGTLMTSMSGRWKMILFNVLRFRETGSPCSTPKERTPNKCMSILQVFGKPQTPVLLFSCSLVGGRSRQMTKF